VPLVFALAALTRPDALLLFGVTTVHAVVTEKRRTGMLLGRRMWSWLLIFAAIYGPYYGWRLGYYGYLLPNTYYAKVGGGLDQYFRGLRYVQEYLSWYGAFVFAPAILLLLRRQREGWRDYVGLLVGIYVLYVIYVGGDGLAFFRFMAYIAPLVYLLIQEGFADLYERVVGSRLRPAPWKVAVSFVLVLSVSLGFTARQSVLPLVFPNYQRWYEPQSELQFPGLGKDHRYTWFDNYFVDRLAAGARWLEANAPRDALVASTPAGSIAYHMNLRVLDMLGLNDAQIAHSDGFFMGVSGLGRAGHEKGDGAYVLSRAPDYILMGNVAVMSYPIDKATMARKLVLKSEHELWDHPEFHHRYELVCVRLSVQGVFQYFTFFKRKDRSLPPEEADGTSATCGGGR
jgi:hypothetical protein